MIVCTNNDMHVILDILVLNFATYDHWRFVKAANNFTWLIEGPLIYMTCVLLQVWVLNTLNSTFYQQIFKYSSYLVILLLACSKFKFTLLMYQTGILYTLIVAPTNALVAR